MKTRTQARHTPAPEQNFLLPTERPTYVADLVFLADLPENWQLEGEAPSPEFVATVRDFGVLHPITVTRDAAEDAVVPFRVDDGRRRIKAARLCGLVALEAHIYPAGCTHGDVIGLLLNEQSSPNPVSDLVAIERLIARGASIEQIRVATRMRKATIEKRLRLAGLTPGLRQALEVGRMKVTTAEAAARLSPEHQARLLQDRAGLTIRGQDIKRALRVVTKRGIAGLSDDLFGAYTDATEPLPGWRNEADLAIDQLARSVPAQERLAYVERLARRLGVAIVLPAAAWPVQATSKVED
jgi:ParB-like chromosome segregation protein Spo0J